MGLGGLFFYAFILFLIVFVAVRLAINPMWDLLEASTKPKEEMDIVIMRDMDVLNDKELEEVLKLLRSNKEKKQTYNKYLKYEEILNELREMNYFTEEDYMMRIRKLKEYFKID